jgi:diguanylate cyclase (GGDEF)-like protein
VEEDCLSMRSPEPPTPEPPLPDDDATGQARTRRHLDTALRYMTQGLCLYDGEDRLVVCNDRFAEIYGIPRERLRLGLSFREIVHLITEVGGPGGHAAEDVVQARRALLARGERVTLLERLPGGPDVLIRVVPLGDGGWCATYEDVTERQRVQAQLEHMTRHDALTGLPNRQFLHERAAQALARCAPGRLVALLSLDVDRLKALNDMLGRAAGDALLCRIAERLRAQAQDAGLAARLGSDEFCVLLPDVPHAEAAGEAAARLLAALAEPYEIDGQDVAGGASIGIAFGPTDGTTPDRLLQHAEVALSRAKADRRGTFRFFEPEMDARLQARRALELDLRRAVTEESFELHYQPLVNLRGNRVCGFEALLRWHHPTRGAIPPGSFIPLAEETGLIVPLGAYVLRRACVEAARWPRGLKLAVNLSAVQIGSPALLHTVSEALAQSGLPAEQLELEITESVLLQEDAATMETLHRLHDLGVRIALDDFGTGYSSLSYLRSFPFDKIKIDKGFVREMCERADAVAIVRAVIGLGRSLKMETTAEGVETRAQLARLCAEGCTEGQGYLFSPPRPAPDIPAMLAAELAACESFGPGGDARG